MTGALTALLEDARSPFLQALGAGVGINASALGVVINAIQLKTAYEGFQQALQTGNTAAREAATRELADKAIGLYAAVGGTLAAIPLPGVKQVGLVLWAGGTAAQQVLNGNVSKIIDMIDTQISETIASQMGGAKATVNQYDIGAVELVTVQFSDKYGINYGEYGAATGTAGDILPGTTTIILTHHKSTGVETIEVYGNLVSSSSFSINSSQFHTGTAFAYHSLNNAFTGNTVDYAQSVLDSIGQEDFSLQDHIDPNSLTYQYSDLLEWFSYDPSFYQQFPEPDFEADTRYNKMCQIAHLIGTGKFDKEIGDRVASGIASPIAIDLDGDGVHILDIDSMAVNFDVTGDGVKERTGWLSTGDDFLAMDMNNNGVVDGVTEMFGGLNRGDGYAELGALDENGDGTINILDSAYGYLKIWQDKNTNGATDDGELASLGKAGVSQLELKYKSQEVYDNRNLIGESSMAEVNGAAVEMADVYFKYRDIGGFLSRSMARGESGINMPPLKTSETSFAINGLSEAASSTTATLTLIDAMAQFNPGAAETSIYNSTMSRNSIGETHWGVSA